MIGEADRHRLCVRVWAVCAVLALGFPSAAVRAAGDPAPANESEASDEHDPWEQLTERPDKRRPIEPFDIDIGGRPLVLGGEYEIALGYLRNRILGQNVDQPDRLGLEQGLELEAFYSFGPQLSLFAQVQVVMEEDLLPNTFESVHDIFVERGEMWLYSENIAGSHVNLDVGRLDFEDDRHWWWDDTLDAVRVAYERETVEISFAVARELGSDRSDWSDVEPQHERVLRLIGEASWDWSRNHALELFVLHQDDRSHSERPGQIVSSDREDDSDARLTWLGARLMGVFELENNGMLGYRLDAAGVFGDERLALFEEVSRKQSEVEEVFHRDVSGWGLDAGATWILPLAWEPRLYAGYAFGSGDSHPETGNDRSFRQTGIESNEAGFGGVEQFPNYGLVLDPELSDLGILTLGAGITLLRSSSLDLVYHYYRLAEPTFFLPDSRLEAELDGESRSLGHGLDLVLAIEEWERLEFELAVGAFRADHAFGDEQGTWSYGGFVAARIDF